MDMLFYNLGLSWIAWEGDVSRVLEVEKGEQENCGIKS